MPITRLANRLTTSIVILIIILGTLLFTYVYFMSDIAGPVSTSQSTVSTWVQLPSFMKSTSRSYEDPFGSLTSELSQAAPTDAASIANGDTVDFSACPYNTIYTYMGWQKVTSKSSAQYRWRESKFPGWNSTTGAPGAFDAEGFAKVAGRYVVATTNDVDGGIAHVGQAIDVYLENGQVIKCVVGDIKSNGDSTWTKWGHTYGTKQVSSVEFIVDKQSWYNPSHTNPGTSTCKPEWKSQIVKIVRGDDV